MDLEVTPTLSIPEGELRWKFSRSSGPGGQHVNTSDSRVQLTWNIATSSAVSDDERALLSARHGASITSAPDSGVCVETWTADAAESTPPQGLSRRKRVPSLPRPPFD